MKPILLLAAIYSLIIHQSHKNAKQRMKPGEVNRPNTTYFTKQPGKKQIISPTVFYNAGYTANSFHFSKWNEKE